jgi:hypothetical protein
VRIETYRNKIAKRRRHMRADLGQGSDPEAPREI